jgi:elongation factor Tu
VADDSDEQDFVLTIVDVFTLTGRGTAVIGPIESGVLRTGEEVEIWDDDRLVTSVRAQVEMICSRDADPRSIGLLLGDADKNLLSPGQTVRRTATKK